jgi:hypothetical protein
MSIIATKTCTECHTDKELSGFNWRNRAKGILTEKCRVCINEYAARYRQENGAAVKAAQKKYYDTIGCTLKKEYDLARLDVVRVYARNKYSTDPQYRMKKILRTRFTKVVKNGTGSKRMLEYLQMPIALFRTWIESQFDASMTWQNHGTIWEIDHVIPIASFDLTSDDEIRFCFAWNNMQPLSKVENAEKSARIIPEAIRHQKSIAAQFETLYPSTKAIWKQVAGVE